MGFLGLGEPSLGTVIILLGAWINRDFHTPITRTTQDSYRYLVGNVGQEISLRTTSGEGEQSGELARWRHRQLSLFGHKRTIETPNTAVFRARILSKVLLRLPFIVEIVYWALIYGVSFARPL
jgi:hypothetical protein